jgi:hypothetical protein
MGYCGRRPGPLAGRRRAHPGPGQSARVLAIGPAALFGDHFLSQAIYLDGVVVVGLLGIIESVELLVDLEVSVTV